MHARRLRCSAEIRDGLAAAIYLVIEPARAAIRTAGGCRRLFNVRWSEETLSRKLPGAHGAIRAAITGELGCVQSPGRHAAAAGTLTPRTRLRATARVSASLR